MNTAGKGYQELTQELHVRCVHILYPESVVQLYPAGNLQKLELSLQMHEKREQLLCVLSFIS